MNVFAIVSFVLVAVCEGNDEKRILTHGASDVNIIIQDFKAQVASLKQELQTLNTSLRQELQTVKDQLQVKKIAFSALMDHIVGDIRVGQIIKFNKVLLNEGHYYNPATGIFTAPIAGAYQFSFFLGQGGTDHVQAWIQLMVEGQSKAGAVVDAMHDWIDIQGGNVVIVRLNANERVWMEEFHEDHGRIYGDNGFTTFSGSFLFN